MQLKTLFPLLLTVTFPASLMAGEHNSDKVHHYLEQMSSAVNELNYEGTFVYRVGEQIQGVKVIHGVNEQGEFEQMVTMNGPRREIIRENGIVKCQLKEDTAFMVQQAEYATPFEINSPEQLKQLKQHYTVELGGRDRVADMPVQRINVKPKDEYRYGYHLWIADQNNHMLLRAEMVDENGAPLEQVMFTSLKLMDHLPEALSSVVNQQTEFAFVKENDKPKGNNHYQQRWVVTSIPPGFEQELARDYMMPEKQVMVEHQLFSDGFSSVSVFIEDSDKANKGNIQTRHAGPVTFVSKFYDDFRVTVVGEVPHVTAKLIATSTKRAGQD